MVLIDHAECTSPTLQHEVGHPNYIVSTSYILSTYEVQTRNRSAVKCVECGRFHSKFKRSEFVTLLSLIGLSLQLLVVTISSTPE